MLELKPGQVIEREMGGAAAHTYRIVLTTEQYLRVVVEQKGIDVVVSVFGPDGRKIADVDSPNGTEGPEPVSLIAEAAGEYVLEVRSLEEKAAPGKYEIKVEELRQSTIKDRDRIAAERAFSEGEQLRTQGTAESLRKAIEKYNEALPLQRKLDDRPAEATTLNLIGGRYWELGDPKKALEYYAQALPIWRALGNPKEEATVLHNFGTAYYQLGDSQKALEYLSQALPLRRIAGDRGEEAMTLNAIGLAYDNLGKAREGLDYHNQALALLRTLGDHRTEAITLVSIGTSYYTLGELQKALDYFNQSLALRREVGDRRGEAATLNNIAVLYWRVGEFQRALEYHNQALPLRRASGDRNGELYTLTNIGAVYNSLGELQKSLEYNQQALSLARAMEDRLGEASTLQNIGTLYRSLGEPEKALDFLNQALRLQHAAGDLRREAITLSQIGVSYTLSGKPQEAINYLDQALSLHQSVGDTVSEAATLQNIARAERDLGHHDEARSRIETALSIVESGRSKFVSQDLRTSYLSSNQNSYEFYIDLLMQSYKRDHNQQNIVDSIRVNERRLARSLLDSLSEAHADIRQGIDPALLERERTLQQSISVKSERLTRLLSGKHTEEQEIQPRKEVDALLADYQDVEAEIRRQSPRYAALTQPEPLSLKEIQQQVLDADTLLLEYSLGEEHSYLWAATPTSLTGYELPKRVEMERAARRFYELVITQKNRDLKAQIEAATALSNMLLGPVKEHLGQKRLLIVGDGALQYIPFAALPDPVVVGTKSTDKYQPLIIAHEIVNQPSASALAVLRRELAGRLPVAKTVAVLADPVFQRNDPRVRQARTDETTADTQLNSQHTLKSDLERSAWESGAKTFERLEYSRKEAEAIVAQAPSGQSLKALDFGASREAALSDTLGQYRIIHFATHSLLNNVHPELSGIVLSLVDERGQPQNGFLRLNELYNLKLPAELVVLSSCQTGLGKEVKGEGLVGLTRGFMYAGAARVVVSSWAVSDEATAELMKRFYQAILKKNLRPAAALRAAQIDMSRSQWWHAPYYWAGFGLQGEWR